METISKADGGNTVQRSIALGFRGIANVRYYAQSGSCVPCAFDLARKMVLAEVVDEAEARRLIAREVVGHHAGTKTKALMLFEVFRLGSFFALRPRCEIYNLERTPLLLEGK